MNKAGDNRKGNIIVVSGPSGVGKSTICQEIVRRRNDICLSVSATTRPKSETEVDGKDYWFISEQEFAEGIDKGLFLEYAKVFGHWYGTPKDKLDKMLESCKTVILEIDVQGGKQAKTIFPDAVMIFILPPSAKTLEQRIDDRGRETEVVAEERLNGAGVEIAAAWQYYKHMVVNEDLEQAIEECLQIIEEECGNEAESPEE